MSRPYNKEVQKKSDDKRKDCPIRREQKRLQGQQPSSIKKRLIRVWKKRGVISEDYDVLYNTYLTTTKCQMCEIVLEGKGRNKKCLDHDHVSGAFRKVLCNNCNWVLMRNK